MASTRSRHIRKLKQIVKHLDTAQLYFSEVGATYQERKPEISEACEVGYNTSDMLRQHVQRIVESI